MSNAAGKAPADEGDVVPRNEFGGVYVDEEELKAAFDFFDVQKKGTLVRSYAMYSVAPGLACMSWCVRA
jgi:hypothetical protein